MTENDIPVSPDQIRRLEAMGIKWPPERIKLSEDDKQNLEALKAYVVYLETEIATAKKAGLDVTRLTEDLKQARALLEGMLREYSA